MRRARSVPPIDDSISTVSGQARTDANDRTQRLCKEKNDNVDSDFQILGRISPITITINTYQS